MASEGPSFYSKPDPEIEHDFSHLIQDRSCRVGGCFKMLEDNGSYMSVYDTSSGRPP